MCAVHLHTSNTCLHVVSNTLKQHTYPCVHTQTQTHVQYTPTHTQHTDPSFPPLQVSLGCSQSVWLRGCRPSTVPSRWWGSPSCTRRSTAWWACCTTRRYPPSWSLMHSSQRQSGEHVCTETFLILCYVCVVTIYVTVTTSRRTLTWCPRVGHLQQIQRRGPLDPLLGLTGMPVPGMTFNL